MSKWRKPLKNKKRFDARYFSDERKESLDEILDTKVRLKRKREAEDLMAHLNYEKAQEFHNFSFDNWLAESEEPSTPDEKDEKAYDHQDQDITEDAEVVGEARCEGESDDLSESSEELEEATEVVEESEDTVEEG